MPTDTAGSVPAGAAAGGEFPDLPGIDTVVGLRQMMNKAHLYERVLRDFHQRFRDEASAIRAALAAGDTETAQRRAHNTKGLAGSIGAGDLQGAALALETAIRDAAEDLPERLEAFAARLQTVIDGIAAGYRLG